MNEKKNIALYQGAKF